MESIDALSLQKRLRERDVQLLDVREAWELAIARIPGSTHIPMGEVAARLDTLDPQQPVAVICHHGMRSLHAAQFLESQGFVQVFNVDGGIDAWARDIDEDMSRY